MSNGLYFFDSNIWLYRFILDPNRTMPEDIRKRETATALTDISGAVVSTQVINEVCANLRRKAAFSENQIRQLIQVFYDRCRVVEINYEVMVNASALRERYNFSFWDGLIVASAIATNAETLYSEDMQTGLVVADRLTIKNPFQ